MQNNPLQVTQITWIRFIYRIFFLFNFLVFCLDCTNYGITFWHWQIHNHAVYKIKYRLSVMSFKYMYKTFILIVDIKLGKIKKCYSHGLPLAQGQFLSFVRAVYSSTLSFLLPRVLHEDFLADMCSMVSGMQFSRLLRHSKNTSKNNINIYSIHIFVTCNLYMFL